MNTRLHQLRKTLNSSQEDFGKRLGVTGASISRLEKGERKITEQMILSICREFNVSEDWFRFGNGDMFLPPDDEVAEMVSRLLDDSNDFYDLILDIMHTFDRLDDKGKAVICKFVANFKKKNAERYAKEKKED